MLPVTDLNTFLYCPRKLYIKQVLGLKESPNLIALKGIILHKVIERVVNEELSVKELLKEELKKNHLKLKSFNQSLVEFFQESYPWVLNETKLLEKDTYETEKALESENLQLKGRVDLIKIGRNNKIPIEIKTGMAPRENDVFETHQLQLAAYIMMLKEMGEQVKEAEIHYIKENEVRNVVFNPFLEKKVLRIKKDAEECLKESIPSRLQEANKCKYCSFEKFCYDDKKVKARIDMLRG